MRKVRGLQLNRVSRPALSNPRFLWGALGEKKKYALGESIANLSAGLCEAGILSILATVSVSIVQNDSDRVAFGLGGEWTIRSALVLLVALALARFTLLEFGVFCNANTQKSMNLKLREMVIDAHRNASWTAQQGTEGGSFQQIMVIMPSEISSQLSTLAQQFGYFLMTVALIAYAFILNLSFTLGLLAVTALVTAMFGPLRRKIKQKSSSQVRLQRRLSFMAEEFDELRDEIHAFAVGDALSERIKVASQDEQRAQFSISLLKSSVMPSFSTVMYGALAFSLAILFLGGSSNVGELGPILLVVLRSLSYGQGLQAAAAGFAALNPKVEYLRSELDRLAESRRVQGTQSLDTFEHLGFGDVSFSYSAQLPSALDGVSLVVERGDRVGVVGRSGGGKSTLIRLLMGFVDPSKGDVTVNGVALSSIRSSDWSSRIGFVPQSSKLFSGSVADNVRFFRSGISDEDIWAALERADFARDVRSWDLGIHTSLGPGGRGLSGGQCQRLTIARALVHDPEILIFDEPTSSVDAESERAVSDSLRELASDVTVIVVSHRLDILTGFSRQVTLEGGRIVRDESLGPESM